MPGHPVQHLTAGEHQIFPPRAPRDLRPRSPAWTRSAGCGPAAEYGAIVVLWALFWLQSMRTLPGRSDLVIRETT